MIRWIRRLTLLAAGAALFIGAFLLPWATWNNLDEVRPPYQVNETALEVLRSKGLPGDIIAALLPLANVRFADHESSRKAVSRALGDVPGGYRYEEEVLEYVRPRTVGFFAEKKAKDQPICFVNAFDTTGDYYYRLFLFRSRADGKLLVIAGDPQFLPIDKEGTMFAVEQVEYEPVESRVMASPFFGSGTRKVRNESSAGVFPLFTLIVLTILLLVVAVFLHSKILTTILVLPALALGIYPSVALRDFVADASKLKLSGIVLDPAIGAGTYVMLAGAVLAAIGGIIVWFEPARVSPAPAVKTTTS
jgi:hypothetical protein